jgi:hypothetical protein
MTVPLTVALGVMTALLSDGVTDKGMYIAG